MPFEQNPTMARPREFDETLALDAATKCFWKHGYEATSVRTLADEMGITGASLYNTFGDKRSLFRRALNHYVESSFGERVSRLEELPPREAIQAFFAEIIERSMGDPQRKGCLLVNSALELAPHDAHFRRAIGKVLLRVEAFFRRCVEAGQRSGTISSAQSAQDVARLLVAVLLGMRVLARNRPERPLLEGVLRPVLALLDTDKTTRKRQPTRSISITGRRPMATKSRCS
jgi:TetR/AcrR family transcriptional repressor of nem operon